MKVWTRVLFGCLIVLVAGTVIYRHVNMRKLGVEPLWVELSPDGSLGAVLLNYFTEDEELGCRLALFRDGKTTLLAKESSDEFFFDDVPVWRQDGRVLAWIRAYVDGHRLFMREADGALRSVSIAGLARETTEKEAKYLNLLSWFPDGEHVLVSVDTVRLRSPLNRNKDSSFWEVSAADGKAVCIARMRGRMAGSPFQSTACAGRTLFFLYNYGLYMKSEGSGVVRVPNLERVLRIGGNGGERLLVLEKTETTERVLEIRPDRLSHPTLLFSGKHLGRPQYGPGGAVFLVKKGEDGKSVLGRLDGGKLTRLASLSPGFKYSAARNGRVWILYGHRVWEAFLKDGRMVKGRQVEFRGVKEAVL